MSPYHKWQNYKNILCIRLDNLGDVLMTSPAIRELKNSMAGSRITLLTSSAGAAIAPFIPEIDDIMVFNPPWVKNDIAGDAGQVGKLVRQLQEKEFDAAIIFTVYSQNPLPAAMLCYQAGIPIIAGYCRENPYQLINHWVPDPEPLYVIKHEVNRQLDLLRHLEVGIRDDDFSIKMPDSRRILQKLSDKGVKTDKPWIILHPGSSEEKRQYPAKLFAEAIKIITDELGVQVVLTGVSSERALAENIRQSSGSKAINLAGDLNMEELLATVKEASLLVSNNTGPVHIAAAVKTPVAVLYALTNPQHTPWKVPHKVLPFDIPETIQSKNTIIRYANAKAFRQEPHIVYPSMIAEAVSMLLQETGRERTIHPAQVLSV